MKKLALAAFALSMFTGCATSQRAPVTGFLFNETKSAEGAAGPTSTAKTGRSCATSILGIVGTGDASITAAAKNGGITRISYVDGESKGILGVWAEYCTVAYGD